MTDYRVEAINLLADELAFPREDGEVPESVLKQFEATISLFEAILRNEPAFPLTMRSASFKLIYKGTELPGPAAQPYIFDKLTSVLASTWRSASDTGSSGIRVITPAHILDANQKQVYP